VIDRFRQLKNYGGAPLPLPIQAASAAVWRDETHVVANRALYAAKFDLADQMLAGRYQYSRPAGGFFLWLNVGDGAKACRMLWREAAVKGLPGQFLAQPDAEGRNPGAAYLRLALVADLAQVEDGLGRIINCLDKNLSQSGSGALPC
jgi:aspartate/methionine/tyrosine aminotransferase